MSRRKRGRAQTPPQVPPVTPDAAASGTDEFDSALRLEIGVAPVEAHGEPEEQVPLPLPEVLVEAQDPAHAIVPEFHSEAERAQTRPETEHRMEQGASPRALGRRFGEARAAQGLSIEDAARRLRFPVPVLADIEADRFAALGAPIYARSYIKSYARLVQLPEAALGQALAQFDEIEPVLEPAVSVQPRPLAPRFATPALYALLTLLLVVPVAVQLYQRSRQPSAPQVMAPERTAAREVALDGPARTETSATQAGSPDAPPDAQPNDSADAAASSSDPPGTQPDSVAVDPRAPGTIPVQPSPAAEPMLASLAPMPARTAPSSGQRVRLQLAESSWVELIGADGSRIEYAMLPGGTTREYQVAGKASLRIGNTRGASLSVDGRPVDLSSYARANVARVSLGEEPPPPADPQ